MKKLVIFLLAISFIAAGCDSVTTSETNKNGSPAIQQDSTSEQSTSGCDRNYSGCVPVASDVDCAGGSGNGPAYVQGPIRVTGRDIYGLDRDGNGIACE
jgi:uncharacterized protein YceK